MTLVDGILEVEAIAGELHLAARTSNRLVDCRMQDFERKNRGKDLAGNQWCQDALKRERFYGLMGPNQCGKTALMRACA